MKKVFLLNCLLILALIVSSGCASIVDGQKKKVKINSTPPGATVTVVDSKGQTVITTNTPAVIRLKRDSGFFAGENYQVRFEAPGFYPSEVPVKCNINPWYFGNIVLGGVIGLVMVDPATGAMWTLAPTDINRNLVANTIKLSPEQLKAAEIEANPPPTYKPVEQSFKGHGFK